MTLSVNEICKSYSEKVVLDRFSCEFTKGINFLTGSSGIGKTTLLRIICGLEKPDFGSITGLVGAPAVMFQEDRLLPWCSALENVFCPFGKGAKASASEILLKLLIAKEDQEKLPSMLSGGMQRRVALARTLFFAKRRGGNVILLDEPFKGLDKETKEAVMSACRAQLEDRITIIVSHDITDQDIKDVKSGINTISIC